MMARRILVLLLVVLAVSPGAAWALSKHTGVAQDQNGRALSAVSITVRNPDTSLATIYSDNGVTALANPFTNDSNGSYEFYAKVGRYSLTFARAGFTFTAADTSDIVVGVIVDTLSVANLPAASTSGRLARATTGPRGLYMDHATAWFSVNGAVANIVDFGAKDDDSTNNSVALQAALDSGYPVWVPPTASSFNFATTLTIPLGAKISGMGNSLTGHTGLPSTLKYTGTGNAMTINLGGGSTQAWGAQIRGLNLTTVQTTGGTWGIVIDRATHILIAENTITNFTTAAASGAIDIQGTIGADDVTLFHNRLVNNSTCVHQSTTGASDVISGWRIIGNQCAGSFAAGGQDGAWQFARPVQAMLFDGNDTNTNANPNEIYFGGLVNGLTMTGNYINSTAAARNAVKFDGTSNRGIVVEGNFLYQSAAAGTGRAIWFSTSGGDGVIVRGNFINAYAAAGATAIDPGGFAFTNSDFSGNAIVGAGTNFGTFGASRVVAPGNSFTATGTGFTTSPTATAYYAQIGDAVVLQIPQITATSNLTTYTQTGMPTEIRPARIQTVTCATQDNGAAFASGGVTIGTNGTITFYKDQDQNGFTNSGTKGNLACSVAYVLH